MAQRQPAYVGGVATIGSGGTVVTVTGALDDTNCIEGDHIRDPATGYESRVLERLTVQAFRVPPWRGAPLSGAAYELYPDSSLRGGYQAAISTQLLARLSAKGLVWMLPAEFASPTAAKWGADEGQRVFSESLKKWWVMQAGAWVQTAAPYGMMASDALADIAALGLAGTALTNLGFSNTGKAVATAANQAAAQTAIGGTTVGKNLFTAADAAAGRTVINAQASLGFTPANKAGDTLTGDLVGLNYQAVVNSQFGGRFKSNPWGDQNLNGEAYASWVDGGQLRYEIAVTNAGSGAGAWWYFNQDGSFQSFGNINITGTLTAGSKPFLIDHPDKPLEKDLVFMATEGPQAGVEFWGTVRLVDGQAEVDLDAASNLSAGTFVALTQRAIVDSLNNQDSFTQVRVGRVVDGRFTIYAIDPTCTDEVAWHVVAERADPFIKTVEYCDPVTGLLIPERDKPEAGAAP